VAARKRKVKLTLFDRAEEIVEKLPSEYVDIIINSVIARSASNGLLLNEASLFLSESSLIDLSKSLGEQKKVNSIQRNNFKSSAKSKTLDISDAKKEEDDSNLSLFVT